MSFFGSIKEKISDHFEEKAKQREEFEQMKRQVEFEKKILFQEEFKKNALEVARAQAYKEAAQKSGLAKLRALNRARRLNETQQEPGSFFARLSEYTKKNIARREENLARTKMMKEEADKMRKQKMADRIAERESRIKRSGSSWKM